MTKTKIAAFQGNQVKWYQYFIRYISLYLVIDIIPLCCNTYITTQYDANIININTYMLLSGFILAIIIIYLCFASIEIATHKRLFYERFSKTKIVSTITIENEDEITLEDNNDLVDKVEDKAESTNEEQEIIQPKNITNTEEEKASTD